MLEAESNQAIVIGTDQIIIRGAFVIDRHNFVSKKDFIVDQLAKHYCGQRILVVLDDGENYKFSGFEHFFKWCCTTLNIPYNKVTFRAQNLDLDPGFNLEPINSGLFECALDFLTPVEKDLSNAKFIGYTIGRLTIPRLRLAYELDKVFANDSYCEFSQVPQTYDFYDCAGSKFINFLNSYKDEIAWLNAKKFDTHMDWKAGVEQCQVAFVSFKNYYKVWNQFHIEVVVETDAMSNYFFSEKTARCIATGKPFVMLSGPSTLANLRERGFNTYGSVIDESYDTAKHPYQRVQMMVQSLQNLYNSPNREDLIDQLYQIAKENMSIYREKYKKNK